MTNQRPKRARFTQTSHKISPYTKAKPFQDGPFLIYSILSVSPPCTHESGHWCTIPHQSMNLSDLTSVITSVHICGRWDQIKHMKYLNFRLHLLFALKIKGQWLWLCGSRMFYRRIRGFRCCHSWDFPYLTWLAGWRKFSKTEQRTWCI